MTTAIEVDDISVVYRPYVDRQPTLRGSMARLRHREVRPVVALDHVSFEVKKGEAFGVIGRNGAGKSTLLRVLAGTLRPDSGETRINGRISTLLQLGVGFNPALSGRQNVYLGGLSAGLRRSDIDEMYDDIVDYAELRPAIDRPMKTYSSGMFSRLGFSIAMHLDPDILLLDEVMSVGDQNFRQKSRKATLELLDRTGTMVLVSHSLGTVKDLCTTALWLDEGRVRMIGEAQEVIDAYSSIQNEAAGESAGVHAPPRSDGRRKGPAPKWPVQRKAEVVLRVLGGEDVSVVARDVKISEEKLKAWRDSFVAAGRRGLRVR